MNYGRYVESKSRSKVTCLQGRNQSHVISYDDVNHSCRHFLDLNTTLVSGGDQASTSVWVRNNSVMTVFPVERSDGQYVANVDGACKAVGGRSANINSLHDAKISGLHLCRCGLLGDNTTRFSVQEDTSSCTKFTSSLLWPKVVACKLSTGEYLNPANLVYCIFS
ncbi:uncharacterized protein LOC128241035 [Mya arenaria]|nr:uncharacterized protein LOC128241028 [Mya arenaria]XP_052813980.1 uncharacterized protein LOC128241035 [Mya arenaria]